MRLAAAPLSHYEMHHIQCRNTKRNTLWKVIFIALLHLLYIRCSFIQQQGTIIIVRYCQLSLSSAFSA
jgi:hypothetical protein